MTFKEIGIGCTVYILAKKEFQYLQGAVTSKATRVDVDPKTYRSIPVVDVTLDINGKSLTFAIPDNHTVTYSADYILSTELPSLAAEVKSMWDQSKQAVESIPYHENIISRAPSVLAEIDPAYRDKKATEDRFVSIENQVNNMNSSLDRMYNMMESFINEFKK